MHRGDGLGIAALRRSGHAGADPVHRGEPGRRRPGRKLRVPVLHGIDRKGVALREWCAGARSIPRGVLYVGNDVNDLGCFELVGWPVAVADAHTPCAHAARAVTTARGGARSDP